MSVIEGRSEEITGNSVPLSHCIHGFSSNVSKLSSIRAAEPCFFNCETRNGMRF